IPASGGTMKHLNVAASIVNLAIFVSCGISCSSIPPPSAAAGGHAMLAPHLPGGVAKRQAAMTGAVSPQQSLNLAIHLPVRNQAELTQLLHDLYDPKSPSFHKYLNVSEFTKRFAVTGAAYYGNGPLTGAGQTIGIFSFDGYLLSDVQLYYSKTGMSSNVPIENVLVAGFGGGCP